MLTLLSCVGRNQLNFITEELKNPFRWDGLCIPTPRKVKAPSFNPFLWPRRHTSQDNNMFPAIQEFAAGHHHWDPLGDGLLRVGQHCILHCDEPHWLAVFSSRSCGKTWTRGEVDGDSPSRSDSVRFKFSFILWDTGHMLSVLCDVIAYNRRISSWLLSHVGSDFTSSQLLCAVT